MPRKFTYEEVKSYIENQGHQLLSTEYIDSQSKLEIKCHEDHIFLITFANFKQGIRCPICSVNKKKHTYKSIKSYIEFYGYKLLSKNYKNNRSKLKIQCPEGHIYESFFSNFQKGQGCPSCSGNKKLSHMQVKENISKYEYKLLSKHYKNAQTKLKIQCPVGHIYESTYNNFQNGNRCPFCNSSNKISNPEKEIQQFISTIYNGKIKPNDRKTILNPNTNRHLELDIYLPEINKAIEFNGTYWHSLPLAIKHDKIKIKECKKLNIDFIIITEREWKKNKNECINRIENFIYPKK